jgi:hypothetical protein
LRSYLLVSKSPRYWTSTRGLGSSVLFCPPTYTLPDEMN